MQLTHQQIEIIENSKYLERGRIMKIEACAGSGKTFTLTQIALACPHKKFLYLAFNKAIVEHAKKRFPANVSIMTTHSLAYRAVVVRFFHGREIAGFIRPLDIARFFPGKKNSDLAEILKQFNYFLHSSDKTAQNEDLITIIRAIENNELPMTHDYYLKLYQVMNDKGLDMYDCILLDEAQDTNDVTLSIFLDNMCAKIIVGDSNQSIYGFRGAINALDKVQADYVANLNISFRSDNEILKKANYFVNTYVRPDRYENMMAMFDKKTILESLNGNENKAVLTRTNAALIEQIANISDTRLQNYSLIKNPRDIFLPSLAIFNLIKGQKDKIPPSEAFFKSFSSVEQLRKYASDFDDREIIFAIEMAEKYGGELFGLYERAKNIFNNTQGIVFLSNAHQAKGLEWAHVVLCSDFASLAEMKVRELNLHNSNEQIEYADTYSSFKIIQEANLYYVAMTRAKVDIIDLSDNDKEYISVQAGMSHRNFLLQKAAVISQNDSMRAAVSSADGFSVSKKSNRKPKALKRGKKKYKQ